MNSFTVLWEAALKKLDTYFYLNNNGTAFNTYIKTLSPQFEENGRYIFRVPNVHHQELAGRFLRQIADAMKEEGWLFASHTWGHQNIGQISLETLQADTQKFKDNVDPLIGGTDIIIFAFGTDLTDAEDYSGDKFEYLKSMGYNYYCNVDSSKYFVQIRDRYFRQGRRNLDGYRMYYNPELLEDLFDAKSVFDPARPTPVPPMG